MFSKSAHHTAKLPLGFRFEITTFTAKGCDTALCFAECYEGSELRSEHFAMFNRLKTVGQLITARNLWVSDLEEAL